VNRVLGRTYEAQDCSIARTLELVGERWSLLILRDAFLGLRRFEQFHASLGIARNVLSSRLAGLVDAGILERVRYQERPERHEYRLTERGRELSVPLLALMHWGDRHLAPQGPPRVAEHAGCGGYVAEAHVCSECGAVLDAGEIQTRAGPGAPAVAAPWAGADSPWRRRPSASSG
jgi:DNA-binding HxlR family transcriptional regulator